MAAAAVHKGSCGQLERSELSGSYGKSPYLEHWLSYQIQCTSPGAIGSDEALPGQAETRQVAARQHSVHQSDMFADNALLVAEAHRLGADLEGCDQNGFTPLLWAAHQGRLAVVQLLLELGARTDVTASLQEYYVATPLVSRRDISIAGKAVEVLLNRHRISLDNTDTSGLTPLHWAAAKGYTVMVELLLSHGADVSALDAWGFHPQHWAAHQGHANCLISLLNYGAALNARDRAGLTPLHWAAANGRTVATDVLMHRKADPLAQDLARMTPLHWAAARGCADVVRMLAQQPGVDVNTKDGCTMTPLLWAAHQGHLYVLLELINNGTDLEACHSSGFTALMWAVRQGHANCTELLLERGADTGAVDNSGHTALHWAAYTGDADVCEVLLRHPLQLDVANANQRTALHIAAAIGSAEVVQQLLDARAGTEVEDREGLTPCALAERRGHHVVASLISFAAISSSTVRPMQCS